MWCIKTEKLIGGIGSFYDHPPCNVCCSTSCHFDGQIGNISYRGRQPFSHGSRLVGSITLHIQHQILQTQLHATHRTPSNLSIFFTVTSAAILWILWCHTGGLYCTSGFDLEWASQIIFAVHLPCSDINICDVSSHRKGNTCRKKMPTKHINKTKNLKV